MGTSVRKPLYAMLGIVLLATFAACGTGNTTGSTENAATYFKGKTLQIIVPYGPGGGYDQWARLVAPYLQKYMGLGKVEVVNVAGGGGLVGTNRIYSAPADGLTIGDTNAGGDAFDQIGSKSGANFDMNKFIWIGRPDNDPHIVGVHPSGPYQSFTALEGAKTTIKALATGAGSSDYNAAVVTYNVFGIPYTMVAAFSGSSTEKAAFVRGDGDTIAVSASDVASLGSKANVILVESTQPFSKLPGVPSVIDAANQAGLDQAKIAALTAMSNIMDLGHAFVMTPGVAADRVTFVRQAFDKAFSDSALLAQAQKEGLYPGYLTGSTVQQMVAQVLSNGAVLTSYLTAK